MVVEKGDVYKDSKGITVSVVTVDKYNDLIMLQGVTKNSKVHRSVSFRTLNQLYTRVPNAVAIPAELQPEYKAYCDLIKLCKEQLQHLFICDKLEIDAATLFVDDDDNVHVVITEHSRATEIKARVNIIKKLEELKKSL